MVVLSTQKKRGKEIVKKAWIDVKDKLPNNVAKKKLKAFADFLVERDI